MVYNALDQNVSEKLSTVRAFPKSHYLSGHSIGVSGGRFCSRGGAKFKHHCFKGTQKLMMDEPVIKVCLNCGICKTEQLKKCVVCIQKYKICSYYCSKSCQQMNWEIHKAFHRSEDQKPHIHLTRDIRNGITDLMLLCFEGKVKELKRILFQIQTKDLVAVDNQGLSALNYAICGRNQTIVQLLVKIGGKHLIFKTISNNVTSLHQTCYHGHYNICKILTAFGGKDLLDLCTSDGFTCFHIACQEGHTDILKHLVNQIELLGDQDIVVGKTRKGLTCFQLACLEGHLDIVNLYCTNLFPRNCFGIEHTIQCLFISCEKGHLALVKRIVECEGCFK